MIACFELETWEEQLIRTAFPNQVQFFPEALRAEHIQLIQDCDTLLVFIYSKIDAATLAQLPNVKLICTMSTGYDHIDIKSCAARGITVCNVPSYGDHTVAEHTIGLLLALTRKLVPSTEQVRRGDYNPTSTLRGIDIQGKTIGIIGTGKIGRNVIRIANGFSMRVIAYDPYPAPDMQQTLNFQYVPLEELFRTSDVISVHVPLLASTKHLINETAFAQMKKGVILLNTSRGGIIDTQALYTALHNGTVRGAGLDVLEEEVAIKEEKQLLSQQFSHDVNYHMLAMNHLLVQHPAVLVTPHNAFNSTEALERIIATTIENIHAHTRGTAQNSVH